MNHLPDERDMGQLVRGWVREVEDHPADRSRQVSRIMGRVDQTHQRRGAWRFLPFGRGPSRIDEDDEELFVAVGGAVGMRRDASSAMALAAVAVLVVLGATLIALLPAPAAGPGAQPPPSPLPTIQPEDVALRADFVSLWSGEPVSLDAVRGVYAEDAVHTALRLDRAERSSGLTEIRDRIAVSSSGEPGDWIPVLDAGTGEHRYLAVSQSLDGIACVIWVRDTLVTRHDCILPTASTGAAMTTASGPTDDTIETWAGIKSALAQGWSTAERELIERTVSPEIVHHVAYDNAETRLEGIDEYMSVMGYGEPRELAAPVPLPAPAGEHRWTDFSSVAGGSLCTFWERDGLILRHDCVVPTFTYVPPPEEPEA